MPTATSTRNRRANRTADTAPLTTELRHGLDVIATTPRLLVATAYNGTLAPLGARPTLTRPLPEATRPLRALAGLPETTVAVISGHALRDLAALSRLPEEVLLVGSHGWEADLDVSGRLDADNLALLDRLAEELRSVATAAPDTVLEIKPASVGIHLAAASPETAEWVRHRVRTGPAHLRGAHLREDRDTVEVSVVAHDKGTALDALRAQADATATVYLGDDVGDEPAFAMLGATDLGIKVGSGKSTAAHRIGAIADVPAVLTAVLDARRTYLGGDH